MIRALEIFSDSDRTDWIPLATKLLSHPSEAVRVASVRALAKKGRLDALETAKTDVSSRVQAYAAFHLALRMIGGQQLVGWHVVHVWADDAAIDDGDRVHQRDALNGSLALVP